MKPKRKRKRRCAAKRLKLLVSWSLSYYVDWIEDFEKALRKKPKTVRIDMIGAGEIQADAALLIRAALLKCPPFVRLVTNAHSSLHGAAVLIWLLGNERTIAEEARVFFRRATLPEDAEVDPNTNGKAPALSYRDSYSELDPEEGDYARALQFINEYLPVNEFAGRFIGPAVLKQFGLIENNAVDTFLANVFAKPELLPVDCKPIHP